jgi:hypothetical protein
MGAKGKHKAEPKTEFLQIRLSPSDRERIWRAAEAHYLEPSTWARQIMLRAVEQWERRATATEPASE